MAAPTRLTIRSICLALPAYNESAVIGELIDRAAQALKDERLDWSIVVVDDGSADPTAARVEEKMKQHPRVALQRHGVNRGLGPAIITGLLAALRELGWPLGDPDALARHMVVCMDADLTHPPAAIPAMRNALDEGADLVIASRFQPGSVQVGVPLFRRLLSIGACQVFRYGLGLDGVRDYTCGFRAFRASLLAAGFAHYGESDLITRKGFACTDELLVHLAALPIPARPVIREVPFTLRYDLKQGASKMKLGVTIAETLKLLRKHRRMLR